MSRAFVVLINLKQRSLYVTPVNPSFVRQTSRIAQKSLSKEINFTYNETETVSAT